MASYYIVEYSNQAGGNFTVEGAFVTWNAGADSGFIIWDQDDGATGRLGIAIVGSSTVPDAADTLTQGSVTADVDAVNLSLWPAYARQDLAVASTGAITWTGPALGATHSIIADAATSAAIVGEILTFTNGAQCEVITVVDGVTPDVEYDVRWITDLDDENFPTDGEAFTGDTAADGNLNGEVYARAYSPLDLHRFLSYLNSAETIYGDDDLSIVDPTATDRSTDQIIKLLGATNISDTVSQHMYGGSVEQGSGNTQKLYSGLNIQVTSPLASTRPVVIQEDSIVTDYWNNAYMPDSIAGNVRILLPTIENGVPIDGQRVRGKLLEFGELYFEANTTLGTATTALALVSSGDGNNNTASGTVAGYSPTFVEGYQTLDFGEGSGATAFAYSMDFDTNNSLESYEYTKYLQRRGTGALLFGRNAQLFTGININFAYDGETGTPAEDAVLAYGTEIPYTGGTGTVVAVGDIVEGGTSTARGRVIYVDDSAGTGTIIVADPTGSFNNTEALTTLRGSGEWTATSGTVVNNTRSGQILLAALDDQGTTGNIYGQLLTGLAPSDSQTLFAPAGAATYDVNGTVSTRTINNQYFGSYTGTNYNPANFGIAISTSDAIAGDQFTNLLGNTISPPDNRSGTVTNLVSGDYITVYPWDGAATDVNGDAEPDFNEMSATTTITGGAATEIVVGAGNIPVNTPSAGFLRYERDSDGNYTLVEYSSWTNTTGTFTLVGTAPDTATTPFNVFRAFIDEITTTTSQSYTAQYTSDNQVAITVRRGGSPNPIKTAKTTATFGAFSVATTRIPDE
jgi:hypothetical protein